MGIIVIGDSGASVFDPQNLTTEQIGQKAQGLLEIPSPWRLPFLCVSTAVFEHYRDAETDQERTSVISATARHIRHSLPEIGVQDSDMVIFRSSGVEEGISERGRYTSQECTQDGLEITLNSLFSTLINGLELPPKMAYVVQKYVPNAVLGHLSNERRFSRVKRDWVYEYELRDGNVVSDRLGVRYWRTEPKDVEKSELSCPSASAIRASLFLVAWYYSKKIVAVHFEFLWDGVRVILAQADFEKNIDDNLFDPKDVNLKVNTDLFASFNVLRLAGERDKKYSKVNNTLIYKKIGLPTVPLYILDDTTYLHELSQGIISPLLEADLRALVSNSIVVRTDIANASKDQKQLLDRSNELRTYPSLSEWLCAQQKLFRCGKEIAFLFHVFVPATGAAFVNAYPNRRLVEIEALWGLPEGLYYNAHDKITVDTRSIDPDIISEEHTEIVSKRPAYKECFIAPDGNGLWVQKRTARPYDWRLCVDDVTAKQIAVESRKIAKIARTSISVMWFLGIDRDYYGTANLAWHHEEYSRDNYTTSSYKKKYFSEMEMVIRNEQDYQAFVSDPHIKAVKIRPVDDKLLRDKDFLKNVGEEAKRKGAAIILDGAVLAHPLYQLCRTGARVLTPSQRDLYKEEAVYNKLVRDKIPDKILSNGENISCYILEADALLRALMEKAVEEAIEIAMAPSPDDLIEELGDEYEVLSSLLRLCNQVKGVDPLQRKNQVTGSVYPFPVSVVQKDQIFDLKNQSIRRIFRTGNTVFVEEVSYVSSKLQVEIHFYRAGQEMSPALQAGSQKLTSDVDINRIFKYAMSLTCYTQLQDIKRTAGIMMAEITALAEQHRSREDFMRLIKKKRDERGGFLEGYMLRSSSLSSESDEDEISQERLFLPGEGFSKLSILDFSATKNADFLDKGSGELVLRISLPLCMNSYKTTFYTNTVKKYTGNSGFIIELNRTGSILKLSLSTQDVTSPFTQLSFPLQ